MWQNLYKKEVIKVLGRLSKGCLSLAYPLLRGWDL